MDEAWRSTLVEDITFIIGDQTVVVEGDGRFSAHDGTITRNCPKMNCYAILWIWHYDSLRRRERESRRGGTSG